MNIELALTRLQTIEADGAIQNLIAQANARYILLNTNERREAFPGYTIKDPNLNTLALYYIELGCCIAEFQDFDRARLPLEKGASILEFIHGATSNRIVISNYYGLISALSYYAAFQYSKAFILTKKFENTTLIAKLVSLFLRRNFNELLEHINQVIIDPTYEDSYISLHDTELDAERKIYEIVIAKSLNAFVQYFYSGSEVYLETTKLTLLRLKDITELQNNPDIWLVIRLLLMILDGFKKASLWNTLKLYFDINDASVRKYILSLIHLPPRGIYELFLTQRKALPTVLNQENNGSIVSVPTSSGKTRIAEIAIFDCIGKNPGKKVLYIAPFRSLAYEVENALGKIFESNGIEVSHLYGGGLFSRFDQKIIEESDVIIATPEKAKAMLRGESDILSSIKLVIIDEGHLFGPDKRHIINEAFYEELKYFIQQVGGKFLLLSAVLPNANELALWLNNSEDTIYKDVWRPSDERFGTLEWNGDAVNLNWLNNDRGRDTFNNNFVTKEPQPLQPKQTRIKYFPSNNNEAIAATAYKLRTFGPVLIFVGQRRSVFTMASAYLKGLGIMPEDFSWQNMHDWKAFELASIETYGENNDWLLYARKGILCHNSDLHNDVRLPLERLMRNDKPLVVIATSTLGQGVNLGISTVIFSTLYQSGKVISSRDFWNIAGRAGRAFVDHEGKVLINIDISKNTTIRERLKIRGLRSIISDCFDKSKMPKVKSGILDLLRQLKSIASINNVSFELLLELIADNRSTELTIRGSEIDELFDWLDDALLAMHDVHNQEDEFNNVEWIETVFSKSLAYIQAAQERDITGDDVTRLITARVGGIIKRVGTNKEIWHSIIKSAILMQSNLVIEQRLPAINEKIDEYLLTEKDLNEKIQLIKNLEDQIFDLSEVTEKNITATSDERDSIRKIWFEGKPLSELRDIDSSSQAISIFYSYLLPWLLNAISKKLDQQNLEEKSTLLEELSILSELGLPSLMSVKIYQCGIRSRAASQEISTLFTDARWGTASVKEIKNYLLLNKDALMSQVSDTSKEWIELLSAISKSSTYNINAFPSLTFRAGIEPPAILIARLINGKQYLLSPDLNFKLDVSGSGIDFSPLNNLNGIYFKFSTTRNTWDLQIENPYIK